jgi:hypothetical protein
MPLKSTVATHVAWLARITNMDEDVLIHDVYINVSWPLLLGIATALAAIALAAVLWWRRR